MRLSENRTSGICCRRTEKNQFFSLIAVVFFLLLASGCATVDATVEKVKSGVSERFNKDEEGDTELEGAAVQAEEPVSASEPQKPAKRPILVEIQEKLRTMGYYTGPISGKLDSRTEAAIQDFQLDNDLRIDGRPTESLLQEMEKVTKLQ